MSLYYHSFNIPEDNVPPDTGMQSHMPWNLLRAVLQEYMESEKFQDKIIGIDVDTSGLTLHYKSTIRD